MRDPSYVGPPTVLLSTELRLSLNKRVGSGNLSLLVPDYFLSTVNLC